MAKKAVPRNNGRHYVGSRIPTEIKDKLERKARRERRSLAAEIELALTTWTATEQ